MRLINDRAAQAGLACGLFIISILVAADASAQRAPLPDHVPPKRSSQIQDGFGINSDLPRDPYLPWNRCWWTRIFDAGFKWIRIGQYEDSSDRTSWDWIEQRRGVFSSSQELEDAIDSLVDNGVHIQVQLLYGNAMYTSPSGKLPDVSTPQPGSFHPEDRGLYSLFWPPTTPDQIVAFNRYVEWMVRHFRDRVHYWALWNEPDHGYWNPSENPEQYGLLLSSFIEAVHKTDPSAKVIYGGQGHPTREFTQRALDACKCASGIDVYAYHTYPGYRANLDLEGMDYGLDLSYSPRLLMDFVSHYPGIEPRISFFDDEYNSIGPRAGADESMQAKYVVRGMVYNLAQDVKTFVWLLAAGTDGSEYDDYGIVHGLTNHEWDFMARPVFYALQNTNALFSDTKFDPSIEIQTPDLKALQKTGFPFMRYGFRNRNEKTIVAYWLAAHTSPLTHSVSPMHATLSLKNTGITHPVLVDVTTGELQAVEWKRGTTDALESLPVKDSIMAITDESYFDWPLLPEVPSSLQAMIVVDDVKLNWQVHGGNSVGIILERQLESRNSGRGRWERIATLSATTTEYIDSGLKKDQTAAYRVRAFNANGESGYSNIVRLPASER